MRTDKTITRAREVVAASLAGLIALGAITPASAQSERPATGGGIGSVVNCDAAGKKQEGGALLGALIGAAAGSNLAKNDRGTGTAIGAVVGAAAGSYVGCKMQRDAETRAAYGYGPGDAYAPSTYTHGGLRLSGKISPAAYVQEQGMFTAATTVNVRGAPSTSARKVGQMSSGQQFQAMARVRNSDWILVGQNGVGIGYVHSAYVRPAGGYTYASYGR